MYNKRQRRASAVMAGILLFWLGLAPRIAAPAYYKILMPRCKPAKQILTAVQSIECSVVPFESGSQEVSGLLFKNAQSRKVIIFFAGRRSNVSKVCTAAANLSQLGTSVFTFEYRGFGASKGHASLPSIVADALAAYDKVRQLGYEPEDIILYGESLGAAIAVAVSSVRRAAGLIVQSGFTALSAQVRQMVPFLRLYPDCAFPKPRLQSAASLRQGHPPVLILHGEQDGVIAKDHARRLCTASGANAKLVILPNAGHFNVQTHPEWLGVVSEFLQSLPCAA